MELPLLYYTQEAVARIGAVRGKGLASAIREEYGLPLAVLLVSLVVVADTINAGADIGAVAGSAHLVLPINIKALIILTTTLVLVCVVFVGYRRYANILKVLGLFLLAYLVTVFVVSPPWGTVLKSTFVPHIEFSTSFLFLLVGTFGTTITAYCWFWQSDEEVEEELANRMIGPEGKVDERRLGAFLKRVRTDTKIGTGWAEVVQWAIIVVCATVLFSHGVTNITTAAQAASALKPLAGDYAKDLFAIGVVGVGLMAIPIFAGVSAYAMSELNGWRKGLDEKVKDARLFYAVIIVSTLIAELMNFVGINMIKALVWTAVIWGSWPCPSCSRSAASTLTQGARPPQRYPGLKDLGVDHLRRHDTLSRRSAGKPYLTRKLPRWRRVVVRAPALSWDSASWAISLGPVPRWGTRPMDEELANKLPSFP